MVKHGVGELSMDVPLPQEVGDLSGTAGEDCIFVWYLISYDIVGCWQQKH